MIYERKKNLFFNGSAIKEGGGVKALRKKDFFPEGEVPTAIKGTVHVKMKISQ